MGRANSHKSLLFLLCFFLYANPAPAQVTFGDPALLNTNGTSDTGTDISVSVATNGTGVWLSVWYSD